MNRIRSTAFALLAVGTLALAGAAYAPHSETMKQLAKENTRVQPCSVATFPAEMPAKPAVAVASVTEDVIARGHSGQ